ncbi:MAG TPA: alpha/beta hydrolase, partial [Puia sp.]|nr:alpha/beta hydrolase [Puia sp.]
SKEYRFTDILKMVNGMEFSQSAFLPEMNKLNLFEKIKSIEIPVDFIQGVHDAVAPLYIARKYFEFLECSSKSFTEFQHSAHLPHLEEPKKFAEVVRSKIST